MTIDALLPPPPIDATPAPPEGPRRYLRLTLEAWLAIGAFAILCIVVLATTPSMLEPDDYAYRASIIALSHGHIWLSASQYASLAHQLVLSDGGHSSGIVQWVHRANGTWISEKNPGYPFFAVPFFEVGLLRVAPLFYGGLASIALYIGGRRWLGRWGGTAAVAMFVSSGAAMIFAWRSTMPTFTDASMVAAGCGLLIWALLNDEATETRRTVVGLLAFLAFDAAVFIRYTNLVALGVAVAVTVLVWIFARRTMPTKRAAILLGSQALFAVLIASLNAWLYGGATSTGYSTGEITFSLGAFSGNLHVMPKPLIEAMPVIALALIALIWIVASFVRGRVTRSPRAGAGRDLAVAAGLTAVWLGVFGLYFFYNWTAQMGGGGGAMGGGHLPSGLHLPSGGHLPSGVHLPTGSHGFGGKGGIGGGGGDIVHIVRFYVPAIGPMALLAAWLLTRIKIKAISIAIVVAVFALGFWGFSTMSSSGGLGGGFGGGFGPGGNAQTGSASSKCHLPAGMSLPSGVPSGGFPSGGAPPSGSSGGFGPPNGAKNSQGFIPPSGGFPGGAGRCTPANSKAKATSTTTTTTLG